MPSDAEFRKFILDLIDEMSDKEQKKFVFLIGDDIPKKKREADLVEIFEILIDRARISATDCSYVSTRLQDMKLTALAYKVARFETRHSPPTVTQNVQCLDNVQVSTSHSKQETPRSNVPTWQEFTHDPDDTDSMVIINNERSDSPVIIEPDSPVTPLSVENIDLKIFESDLWPKNFLEKINVNIQPYEYQRKLVQNAIQAKNTIICLRSGGGKTFVAALLIKYYFIKKMTILDNKEEKFTAFFIVPRRAMLQQQVEKIKQIGNLHVIGCDEYNNPTQYINTYDVIVCTPQKLLNCLKAKTILISNIDLICFDDCHDIVVRNQYIGIMQYLMCKEVDTIPSVTFEPIIIGLTAAVGFRQSNSTLTINTLTILCAIFNCLTITTIMKEHEEELERYVSHTSEDEIICIDKQKDSDSFNSKIETDLKNLIFDLLLNKEANPSRIFPEKDVDVNGYEQNLELLKQSQQKNQQFSSVLLLSYILAIYRHLKSLKDLTPVLILQDLKDHFNQIYQSREHPMDIDTLIYEKCQDLFTKKLTEIEQSQQILSNPKLDKLVELLIKHIEKPDNRALILVERTFYTKKICEFLQNHSQLKNIVKPCSLVGHNRMDRQKSNKKEDPTLKGFQTGVYNVMISTDVVQAGLDIPQCSLVLRFDFVPDSIGTVQARVRALTKNCIYYLITTSDSSNYTKELENRACEQYLKEAVEEWKRCPSDELKRRIMNTREGFIAEWSESLRKPSISQTNVSKKPELTGEILCAACDYFLGKLEQIRRHGESYFVDDHDFYNRIDEKLLSKPEVFKTSSKTGKARCGRKSCRAELGNIVHLHDVKPGLIYPLKCKSIKIKQIDKENGKETIHVKKQWCKMPFNIPEFEIPSAENDEIFYDANDTVSSDS